MNKLNAMQTFVQIVENGSLTKAADSIGTSLPTVVRTLAGLEEYLDTRLLNRTTRKITLTVEGKNYYDRCKKILSDIKEAEVALLDQAAQPSGKLKITASPTFGNIILAPLISEFLKQQPNLEIEMSLMDRNIDLIEEGIDVAFRIGGLSDSSMVAKKVGETRKVICATPELLNQLPEIKQPEDLSELPCVRFNGFGQSNLWQFYRQGQAFKVPVKGQLMCNQLHTIRKAVLAGQGLGWFLCYQVNELLNQGELATVLEEFEPQPSPINVIFSHTKLMSTRVRVFVDWITAELRSKFNE